MTKVRASALIVLAVAGAAGAQDSGPASADWRASERPALSRHVQLTMRESFVRAGEAYFGPGDWIIFQAIPAPDEGKAPDPFYSMYVAKLTRDEEGRIGGIDTPILISPPGSANTCGWFHPTVPGRVIFGSTLGPPATDQRSGFQVGTRKYVWLFPQETEIVAVDVPAMLPGAADPAGPGAPEVLFSRPEYDAECSISPDGRFILYAGVREERGPDGRADADIWIFDTATRRQHAIITADGYDGGPFFSPDGARICYRSDRRLNDKLQLFVADLKFEDGVPVGVARERQITDNDAVNWAPFWHPSGRFVVYGTSEIGHDNYEVFAIEADGARRVRLTHAPGADILPAFNADGTAMMWTSQRGPAAPGEQRPSSQLWVAEFDGAAVDFRSGATTRDEP